MEKDRWTNTNKKEENQLRRQCTMLLKRKAGYEIREKNTDETENRARNS